MIYFKVVKIQLIFSILLMTRILSYQRVSDFSYSQFFVPSCQKPSSVKIWVAIMLKFEVSYCFGTHCAVKIWMNGMLNIIKIIEIISIYSYKWIKSLFTRSKTKISTHMSYKKSLTQFMKHNVVGKFYLKLFVCWISSEFTNENLTI